MKGEYHRVNEIVGRHEYVANGKPIDEVDRDKWINMSAIHLKNETTKNLKQFRREIQRIVRQYNKAKWWQFITHVRRFAFNTLLKNIQSELEYRK